MSDKRQAGELMNTFASSRAYRNIGKLGLLLVPLVLSTTSYAPTARGGPAAAPLSADRAFPQRTEVRRTRTKGRTVPMTDLRSAISKSAGHDAELQQKLVRIVEQAETSAVRGNKAQAARNLNSITMTVFSTPESRLSKEQKVSIMVALDKSWREFRLVGRKAHVRRDGHCCNLQKGRGRCLPDSENPDNVCFEGQNARGQWSCISNKPCPGQ